MAWDPLTRLFFWLGTTGALGVLILIAAASFAVVDNYAALLGVTGDSAARWALPTLYPVAIVAGAAYLALFGGERVLLASVRPAAARAIRRTTTGDILAVCRARPPPM